MGSKCSQCVPGSLVPHYPPQPISLSEMGTAPKKTSRTIQHGQNGSRMFLGWGDPTEPQPCQKSSFMCALNRANNGVATLAESFAQRVDPAGKAAVAHPASDQRRFPPARAGRVPFAPLSRASAPQPPLLLLLAEPSERRIFLLPGPQPRRA
ncbi:gametocyte-specific factor 2 isoform X4 [Gallus gallus]|uniref:gametocyte-specific factor 2 isoform X4 n=1 Tax=Gallus gallus TaxID=9031 RepID=UPI001AE9C38F|nr:gametocyte-specific factor 2 isoform X4 [Gallus gallus]